MSILSVLQSVSTRIVGRKPTAFFSVPQGIELELVDLATEAAQDIAESHDWQALTKLHTVNGDGATTAFPLPSDYGRMLFNTDIHSGSWSTWRYSPARDLNQWQDFISGMGIASPGTFVILGGELQIYPSPATGETAKFYYITKNIAVDANGSTKDAFTKESDEFAIDQERLLTLNIIWRWRAQKRLEYAEDMRNYEIALARATGNDKGRRLLKTGPSRFPADVRVAYPGALGS